MLAFAADTDLLLFQKVSEEILAAIHAAGYDYRGGAVMPRPGKEETDMAEQETKIPAQEETQTAPPMKLDVSVRAIQPMGTLLGFATVKFYDCFVVEDFKILQTDKGLYVGMPSKPDKTSRTGYRDTAKPITGDFWKQLQGAVLEAYSAELGRLRAVAAAQEQPSIKSQLEASAKRFEPYQDQAGLQLNEAPAYLFFHSGRDRRTLLPSHPLPYREQHCPVSDDRAHAPMLSVRHVREGRPSIREGAPQHHPYKVPDATGAALQN